MLAKGGNHMSNMKAPLPQCAAMVRVQNILSGKWKITILWYIAEYEVQRFGELSRRLGDITQSTLTKQLRELDTVHMIRASSTDTVQNAAVFFGENLFFISFFTPFPLLCPWTGRDFPASH